MNTMSKLGVKPDVRTQRRFELSIQYAVEKEMRRGMTLFPQDLQPYQLRAA